MFSSFKHMLPIHELSHKMFSNSIRHLYIDLKLFIRHLDFISHIFKSQWFPNYKMWEKNLWAEIARFNFEVQYILKSRKKTISSTSHLLNVRKNTHKIEVENIVIIFFEIIYYYLPLLKINNILSSATSEIPVTRLGLLTLFL